MSLQNLAKELEKKGRGKDRMLVHMTPREVSGLQSIAKAHGGSLTVNPDTGLVEAGFLDNLLPSLLPMAAGAALASTGIGAPAAAMLIGGGYGLATGSVEKGLMAGLGAYGGANLAGGLANAATAPVEQAATAQATTNAAQAGMIPQVPVTGAEAAPGGFQFSPSGEMVPSNYSAQITGAGAQPYSPELANFQSIGSNPPAQDLAAFNAKYGATNAGTGAATNLTDAQAYQQAVGTQTGVQGGVGTPAANKGFTFDQLKSGYANTDLGKFAGQNYGQIGMAVAPVVSAAMEPEPYQDPEKKKYTGGYRLSPDFQGYTPVRPEPYYTPRGLGYAEGGDIKKEDKASSVPQPKSELMKGVFAGLGGQPGPKSYEMTDPITQGLPYMIGAKMRGVMGEEMQDKMAAMFAPQKATGAPQQLTYDIDPRTGQVYTPTGLGYVGYAMGGSIGPQLNNMPAGGLAALQGMRDGYGADQTFDGNIPQFNEGKMVKKPKKAKLTGARSTAVMDPYEASMAELNNARYGANMSQMDMPKTGIAGLGELPYAMGGSIGGYSDGGRMLKGPGDGMSDSIPATINRKQPARLADGEFVVPADVVSHLGNGSTDAGAKRLYSMMDKVRKARTGKKKQAPAVKAERYMPA
jgi:hypothetical protein